MNTSKQLELLNLLKKNIKLALPVNEGLLIQIEFVETDKDKIKLLKEWLLK